MLRLSSFSSRRSHLDSASYRTLVRIFSLCLDEQIPAPNLYPNRSFDSDGNGHSQISAQQSEPIHDPNLGEELGHCQIEKGAAFDANPQNSVQQSKSVHDPNPNPGLNCDHNGNCKLQNELGNCRIMEVASLVENPQNSAQQRESIHDIIPNPSLHCCADRSSKLGDELGHCQIEKGLALVESSSQLEKELGNGKEKDQEKLHAGGGIEKSEAFSNSNLQVFDAVKELELDDECVDMGLLEGIMINCAKLIDGDKIPLEDQPNLVGSNQCLNGNLGKDIDSDKSPTFEKMRERGEGTQQETFCQGQVDGEDFEEGEIQNDFGDANQHSDFMDECEDKKLEESSASKDFDKNGNPNYTNLLDVRRITEENYLGKDTSSTLIFASNQGLLALGDDICLKHDEKKSCTRDPSVYIKCTFDDPDTLGLSEENLKNLTNAEKKRSSKTEVVEVQVKTKHGRPPIEKRKAKKKRAKKRKRAQKEREQGVKRLKLLPIVKPKEIKYCNFYLVGRCQQGEMCKFSHDTTPLTKSQPCKYFSCDSCLKGDDCPFDHQLSKYPCYNYMSKGMCVRGDGCKFSHKLPVTEGSSPTSETSKAHSVLSTKKSNFVKQLPMNRIMASSSQFIMQKPFAGNLVNGPKEPMQIPDGIRFISFDKGPLAAAADKPNVGQQNATSSVQSSIHAAECEKNTIQSSMNVYKAARANAARKSKVDDRSRSLQTEVSEASKILEEFLFCGAS